jgi:hypothetical protein
VAFAHKAAKLLQRLGVFESKDKASLFEDMLRPTLKMGGMCSAGAATE